MTFRLRLFFEANDRGDNGGRVGVGRDVADERAIDLELADGKLPKIAEAGVAGAEIIDGQFQSHMLQILH
jgi:hypothetical protein